MFWASYKYDLNFQPSESLEDSREATPDSDSGYVVATVTTTTTTTTTTRTPTPNHSVQKPQLTEEQPKRSDAKFSFLSELQGLGKSTGRSHPKPVPKEKSPQKGDDEEEPDVPVVNPFKVLKPAGSNPRRIVQQPSTTASAPTLADQVCRIKIIFRQNVRLWQDLSITFNRP